MKKVTIAFVAWFAYACASSNTTQAPLPLPPQNERGVASWYGQEFAGRTTANGEIFDPLLLTAAHRTLPFGTIADVRNPKTNQTVRVRINDRGPYIGNRTIDLSYAAAQQISLIEPGSGEIELTVIRVGKGDREPPTPFSVTIGNDTPAPSIAASTSSPSVSPAPAPGSTPPAVVNNVQVETRRQVSPSGTAVETVPLPQPAAPTSVAARRNTPAPAPVPAWVAPAPTPAPQPAQAQKPDVAAAPGHEPSAAYDRARLAASKSSGARSAPTTPAPAPAPAASASTVTDKTATASSTPGPTPGGKYVVQVGAFSQEPNAKSLQDRLKRIGHESYVDHTSLYFVRIGPFATRDQAAQVRSKLEGSGISAIVIVP